MEFNATERLVASHINLTDEEANQFLTEFNRPDFVTTGEATEELIDAFNDSQLQGDSLPYEKTHKIIRLRPGEVSLWGGYNGSGKSQFLGMVAAWNLHLNNWAIASLEMPYIKSLKRIVRQAAGSEYPDNSFIEKFNQFANKRLWFYDRVDSVPSTVMLGVIGYAAHRLKVKHFVIDSLVKCRIGREDYDKQMQFVEKLSAIAKQYGIHIHLVHHMRKKESEENMPTKFDFRGAGELTDLVDNVFIFYRNKKKERLIRSNKANESDLEQPDQYLLCEKQRYGEWEGPIALWFNQPSLQYTPTVDNRVMPYYV